MVTSGRAGLLLRGTTLVELFSFVMPSVDGAAGSSETGRLVVFVVTMAVVDSGSLDCVDVVRDVAPWLVLVVAVSSSDGSHPPALSQVDGVELKGNKAASTSATLTTAT